MDVDTAAASHGGLVAAFDVKMLKKEISWYQHRRR